MPLSPSRRQQSHSLTSALWGALPPAALLPPGNTPQWIDLMNTESLTQRSPCEDWSESYGVTWDDASQGPELYEGFIKAAIEHAILPNAAWYCWHASRRQAMVEGVWEKFGAFVHQQIVWAKDRGILTRSYYLWQHEPCFFGWLKGNKPPRVSDDYPSTVWNLPTVKVGEKTDHPTSKPSRCSRSRCASMPGRARSATNRSAAPAHRSSPARPPAGGCSPSRSARNTSTWRWGAGRRRPASTPLS